MAKLFDNLSAIGMVFPAPLDNGPAARIKALIDGILRRSVPGFIDQAANFLDIFKSPIKAEDLILLLPGFIKRGVDWPMVGTFKAEVVTAALGKGIVPRTVR